MKCEDVHVLLAAYRRSEWTLEDQRAVSKHLAGCAECRRWEADARSVGEHLRELPTITPPASLRERVFAAIREEQVAANAAPAHENAVTVAATKKPATPISIGAARSATTSPVRAMRSVSPSTERVGEVAIGKMRAPRVLLGRNTAIATVAALFAIIFLIRALPVGTTLSTGPGPVTCVSGCSSPPHTFKADKNYPTVTSAVANGSQAVFVGKSTAGQEMLSVTDFSTKKTVSLLDAPTSSLITVVALTPKMLVWTVGNPASAKSNWQIEALPLTNGTVPTTGDAQPVLLAAHSSYLQGDSSALLTVTHLWIHGQSTLLVVTTQHTSSELVRADLSSDGFLFTDTTIAQAASDHAIVDPYLDDTTMYWVDVTTAADGSSHHVIWQQSLQSGSMAAAITSSDVDAFGPVTDQQGVAWLQTLPNATPEYGVGDTTTPLLSVMAHQGTLDTSQAATGSDTGLTAQRISRADGYFFWMDATGAHLYRPDQPKSDLGAIPTGATILGLSPNAITWITPTDTSTVWVQFL